MGKTTLIGILVLLISQSLFAQASEKTQTNLAGVYQGKTLFIQNPLDKTALTICVESVRINEKMLALKYNLSALKIDFELYDLFTPLKIQIIHKDSICTSTIINPEAILFHTIFRFVDVSFTDSALVWSTKGESGIGTFEIERLMNGVWVDQEIREAVGRYEGISYTYYPNLEEGANKYRIRYNFPSGRRNRYLYSREVDFDFYPEPVEFTPKSAKTRLFLSRSTHYEIYNDAQKLVLEGQGKEIDVTVLRRGRYIIYFNGNDPGTFIKEKFRID